jgi:hypothetical protein
MEQASDRDLIDRTPNDLETLWTQAKQDEVIARE